ncbi:uncharacterized protein LOC135088165 [Ostrinia nubilalis]|uniref:uncharacterized protein LOC135088165 n=1 Tax=Ostrinia nubilalis TaxID=29057 RepID=UPI0030825612
MSMIGSTKNYSPEQLEKAVEAVKMPIRLQLLLNVSEYLAIQLEKKPAKVQAATFMAVIGPDAIEIYNSFNLSDADKNNLQTIINKFVEYFAPKSNISFERYIFFKIEQNEDEHFNEFLTRIKTQARKCEFDNLLDEMLKDKIVFGIRSNQLPLSKAAPLSPNKCKKNGHFANMCKSKKKYDDKKNKNRVNTAATEESSNSEDEVFISVLCSGEKKDWSESIQVGEAELLCKIKNEETNITFKVVEERVTPILGLETCKKLRLIARVKSLKESTKDIFNGLGCYKNYEYDIDLIENPKFEIKPSRRIPHAIRKEVKHELDRMVKMDVIKPETEPTPAVSPMVVVRQKDKIRICIDPSDVNKNILRRHYPLTTIEEISADIKGSKYFALLDCTKGFWQIRLTERTQKILTFATPWGRYSFKRLPFGVSSAPEIFQEILSNLLCKFQNVRVAIDDIFIYDKSKDELHKTVREVIDVLNKSGFKLNKNKCIMEAQRIKFLGHIVSANGLEADPEKVEAIQAMKTPKNKTELQRLLGMITYLNKFIPNMVRPY